MQSGRTGRGSRDAAMTIERRIRAVLAKLSVLSAVRSVVSE
jgi:hypothetical protein